jgi:hypothetical protein
VFNLFKRQPKKVQLSLIELSREGYCAVVGESHYQDALRATRKACAIGSDGRPTFTAVLVPERNNPYDSNAVGIHSPVGKLGYLSRENAAEYREVFDEVIRLGYDGGACDAHLTGGEPGKPSFGVVLLLAAPSTCFAELRAHTYGDSLADDEG